MDDGAGSANNGRTRGPGAARSAVPGAGCPPRRPPIAPMPNTSPSYQPLYLQIKALLERRLEAAEWRPGEAIPSEQELARRFGVSQGTVRKAIDALAADNLVVRRQGRGTFVSTHTEEKTSNFRFLRVRRSDGRDEESTRRLLEFRRARAGADVARRLGIKPGAAIVALRRVLEFGGEPVILEDITLPAALFPGLGQAKVDASPGSLYGFFETQFGVRMLRAHERLTAIAADAASATALRVAPGSPLLAIERIAYTYGDRPVELRRSLCRTDRHHYANDLG